MKKKLLLIAVVIFSAATCFGQNFRALQKRDWAYLTRYADENAAITKTPKVVSWATPLRILVRQRPDFSLPTTISDGHRWPTTSEMLVRFARTY